MPDERMEEQLNFPALSLKTRQGEQGTEIWDPTRQKFLKALPEEWVRQSWIAFFSQHHHFPLGTCKTEVALRYLTRLKRVDILWHSPQGKPLLLIECKAPHVKIKQEVFNQIGLYNIAYKVPFLIVSNGLDHRCVQVDYENKKLINLTEIPTWKMLLGEGNL